MIPNKFKFMKSLLSNLFLNKPVPFILLFDPSQICNARCKFCYHWKEDKSNELDKDEIAKVLREAYDLGCGYLLFNGGEPFVNPHLDFILKEAYRIGYGISVTTNGFLLKKFIPKYGKYIHSLTVSIDYPDERHDKERVLKDLLKNAKEGIKEAKKYVKNIKINCSVHKKNLKDLKKMAELAKELGVHVYYRFLISEVDGLDGWLISDMDVIRNTIDEIKELKKQGYPVISSETLMGYTYTLKNFKCRVSTFMMHVDSNGRVFNACVRHEGKKDSIFGNIRESSLKDIWYSNHARSIRERNKKCKPFLDCYSSCVLEPSLLLQPDFVYIKELLTGDTVGKFFKKK